ncbi:predicted protein [Pyrenophora tritici-repentis Pt-1C-BFP]|uniref:Uncharacterized protein n=1 Tax=Pyrenophora tritici-repentis (strain Pt-1C-BFP) TaxID=426418 RepID=B2WEX5_PYRTR|nr:uncharacterized protein PTRG_08136 [Pyrenophora tritici-repentis Pt-1C-BFP]EDU51055.1 predicted protein [Pyrenophora tritici-repentis Pt-1C-BFP]
MKIPSIAIISSLAVVATAADYPAMKFGPPSNWCSFLSAHPEDKYYCGPRTTVAAAEPDPIITAVETSHGDSSTVI